MDIDKSKIDSYDTFQLERIIYDRVIEQSWTSLNENERIEFLEQSGWDLERDKIISLAALSGASFLAGLSAVVDMLGFSFYIGMSNCIFAIASSWGIVLPFAAYTGASVAIKLATGPIGWVAAAVLAGVGVYHWIKANKSSNEADMLRTVLHLHHYKISAMQEANIALPNLGV